MSKEDLLTADLLRTLLHYDPLTGVFTWHARVDDRIGWNRQFAGKVAGTNQDGYIVIKLLYNKFSAHRLAWLYMTGSWPEGEIDHKDLDKTNNAIDNLRLATRFQNARNMPVLPQNTSGYPGVAFYKDRGKWGAYIKAGGKRKSLGFFDRKEDAIAARVRATEELHGEFTPK